MSVDIIDVLLGEHGMLNAVFESVERGLPNITTINEVKYAIATIDAGLRAHAGLEDKLLIPAMERKIGHGGALAVMRDEHTEIEDALYAAAVATDFEEARGLVQQVMTLAARHFAKEEKFLFPLARHDLTAGERAALGERWAELRCVVLAPRPGQQTSRRRTTGIHPPWGQSKTHDAPY